jgi:hypothetical protein
MKIRIGCDPGKNGGIVALTESGKLIMYKTPLVNKEIDINKFKNIIVSIAGDLSDNGNWKDDVLVVIEDVHSIFGAGAKSNFQFGRALGILEGIVSSLDIPFIKIQPKKWQEICFAGVSVTYKSGGKMKINKKTGKEELKQQVDTKAMALQAAKRFFPNTSFKATDRSEKDHDGIVDSVLLAKFGMLKY